MKSISLILRMVTDPEAPEGPGWYVYGMTGDQPVIPTVKVAPAAAQVIGESFDTVLRGLQLQVVPSQLVSSGHNLIRQAVQEQLSFAEAQAQRVKGLRRDLEALGSSDTVGSESSEDRSVESV